MARQIRNAVASIGLCGVLVAVGVGVGFGAAPRPALASPATESDFFEIKDGGTDVNLTVRYQTDLIFRGVRQADDVLRLQLKGRVGAGPVDLTMGIASAVPFDGMNGGIEEPREVNGFLKARFNLAGVVTAEAGLTYYGFVGTQNTPGAETETLELFAGARLPLILPVFARVYYDVEVQNLTIETESRWRLPLLGERLALEFSGRAGYVHTGDDAENLLNNQAGARTIVEAEPASGLTVKDNRAYYEVGAALSSRISRTAKIGAHLNWAGTTGEYLVGGRRDDETLYGGLSLNLALF
ncbi:MAG: hypothetical protein ACFB6R_02510 [Alphaproteobacteria bacterium]